MPNSRTSMDMAAEEGPSGCTPRRGENVQPLRQGKHCICKANGSCCRRTNAGAAATCTAKGRKGGFKWKKTVMEPPCSKLSHNQAKRHIEFLSSSSPWPSRLLKPATPRGRAASFYTSAG